jgi:thiol-disulfide isomerase/thioredoxin
LVRVVVESPESMEGEHRYRTQNVHGMLGNVTLDGETRLALLYDANGDGLYRRANSDGIFFDLNNDRHFVIDVMARDFGPFAIPFSIDDNSYSVESVDIEGKAVALRSLGPSAEQPAPTAGLPAPDFKYTDVLGRPVSLSGLRGRVVVVYFWSTLCGGCRRHADALAVLYRRYDRSQLEILGVSNDADREAMARFRTEHKHTWPTSFTGGFPAEDPVGRLYRETGSGVFYIVAPDGRLLSKHYEVEEVEASLADLFAKPAEALGSRP